MSVSDAETLAPSARPSSGGAPDELSREILGLAEAIEQRIALGDLDTLTPEAAQALAAAACRTYSTLAQSAGAFPALPPENRVMDTDVMLFTSALLKSAGLEVFELGMWQSWTGR